LNTYLALLQLLQKQADLVAAQAPLQKIFEALEVLLPTQKVYLMPRKGAPGFPPAPTAEFIGYADVDDDGHRRFCLIGRGDPLLRAVREYYLGLGEHFDVPKENFRSELQRLELLVLDEEGNNISLHTPNGQQRLIVLRLEKIEKLFGVTLTLPMA
jgi:hypothetical protein